MASAACEIAVGFRSSAEPGTTNSVACVTRLGFASAAAPVAWAGNQASRNVADWLPRIDEKVIDPRTGCFTARWYNYFRALGERLGGVQGPSIPQVQQSVAETQVQVAATTSYAVQVSNYAQGVAATASATASVTQSNGLSGAGSIPDAGDPPVPPGYQQV